MTRQLTADIVAALTKATPGTPVVYRDLAANPPEHLTAELLQVVKFRNLENLNPHQLSELALTDTLVEELLAAETVVIGAPMYNFSIPTQLKVWLDRLCQAGRTFRYTEKGPVGLAGGRKVIIASARGGRYAGTPMLFDYYGFPEQTYRLRFPAAGSPELARRVRQRFGVQVHPRTLEKALHKAKRGRLTPPPNQP